MKYLRSQNLNLNNILDDAILKSSDGNIELNPKQRVVINGDLNIIGGGAPGPEVTNVMYVTVDGNDANSGKGEGPDQAKRTIKAAVLAAQEGTTIFVRSGEYYEDNPIRLPPKVSIIGDNLRRTILRPLNGPKKFNIISATRTNGVVTVTTDQPHEFYVNDRVRVIVASPSLDIDDECANIISIPTSSSFTYRDYGTDFTLTAVTSGTVEKGFDFFLVNNQSYVAQLVFKGLQAPAYCINIDRDAIVDTSPYIQNCSNINGPWMRNGTEWLPFQTEQPDLTGTMVTGPRPLKDNEIFPALVDQYGINERGAGGGMLIDGDRYNSESPIKSMVADAFTQIAQGAVGFHITNFGYMQLVSCFAVFCDKAFYTTKGGYLSISNSVCDFGNYGFVADGYYPIQYSTAIVPQDYYSSVGSVTVNNIGVGYTTIPTVTIAPPVSSVNWAATTSYTVGTVLRYLDNFYTVTVAGISGSSGPTHTTGTVSNGTTSLKYRGTQAVGTASIDSLTGTVNAISIEEDGYGYTSQPSITITGGGPGVTVNATATANLFKNLFIRVDNLPNKPQVGSVMFLGNDPVGYYISGTNNSAFSFNYDEQKCRRDVEYIVNAVLADTAFNSNYQSIASGLAYLRSYSSKVTSLQKSQTIAGIQQARDIILANPSVSANATAVARITTNFNIVINIINNGTAGAPPIVMPNLVGRTNGYSEAKDVLLNSQNLQFIQDEIVNWISNNITGFEYDEVKCARDVGLILEAVLNDLVLGSNYLSINAGLAYIRSYSSTVTSQQKEQTIFGINRARDIALSYVTDIDTRSIITENFKIITDIITAESGRVAPDLIYTNPVSATSGLLNGVQQLINNKQFIVDEIIAYIDDNLNPAAIPGYSESKCARDTGYIVDALAFDLLYGGNSASVLAAEAYFDASSNSVIPTEITQTVSAYTRLKEIVNYIVLENNAWTKSTSNTSTQNVSGTAGDSTTATAAQTLVQYVLDVVNPAAPAGPVKVYPTYSNGAQYSSKNTDRAEILADTLTIQADVIAYLNNAYGGPFSYNEAKCRRDVRYIIEAIAYDLAYGGNTQTRNAALAYSEGSVLAGDINETVDAYKYLKSIIGQIIQNQVVDTTVTGQNVSLPLGNPVPVYGPANTAEALLQIVIDVIDYGTGYVPDPVDQPLYNLADVTLNSIRNTVLLTVPSIQNDVIDYLNALPSISGETEVTVFPGIITVLEGTEVRFHNVSTISTGGTALEYVGSGVTYNSLPFFGGEPIPANERIEINNGKCFTVTNDQVGNFRVGEFFKVNALTGEVTIDAEKLNLSGLASIGPFRRNGIPVGVELREVSNNTNLISSLGTQDGNTAPTQYAVSTYVENRYLNKVQSSTPQTVDGEVTFNNNVTLGTDTSDSLTIVAKTTVEGLSLGTGGGDNTTNTVFGLNALSVNTTGVDNVAVGSGALEQNIDGYGSVAIGVESLNTSTSGWNNTAVGYWSMRAAQAGVDNVAVGALSLYDNDSGNQNTAIGKDSLTANVSGDNNTSIGYRSLYVLLSGNNNTALGRSALQLTTGSSNIGIGYNAGSSITTGSNNVVIGSNNGSTIATADNNIIISDGEGNIRITIDGTTLSTTSATVVGTNATQALFNTVATTVNAFGAATTLNFANTASAAQTVSMFGTSTGASTYSIAHGATDNATTKTINIGTNGVNGSTTNITLGSSTVGAIGTTTINGTTVGISTTAILNGTTKTINIGTNGVNGSTTNITLGSSVSGALGTTTINGTAINVATNSATAVTTTVGPSITNNIFKINSTSTGTITLSSDVATGTVNLYTELTTGTMNVGSANDGKIVIAFTTDTTNSTTGALQVAGGVMIAKDLFVGGGDIITDEATFNLLNTTPTTINAFDSATDVNISNVTTSAVTVDIATAATGGASTLTFGGAVTGNTFKINSVTNGTINLSSDVTIGSVNLYTGLTTGTMNVGSANDGKLLVAFTTNATSSTTGSLVVSGGVGVAKDIVGSGVTTSIIDGFTIDDGIY